MLCNKLIKDYVKASQLDQWIEHWPCQAKLRSNLKLLPDPEKLSLEEGKPLRLIEYIIERVYQVFCHFNYHKFGIFWNLHQPKGVPSHTIQKWQKMARQNTFEILLLNDANLIGEH